MYAIRSYYDYSSKTFSRVLAYINSHPGNMQLKEQNEKLTLRINKAGSLEKITEDMAKIIDFVKSDVM